MPIHNYRNLSIYYESEGAGETALLFVHGLGGSHRQWKYQKEFFRTEKQIITPDLFEHGDSQKGIDPTVVPRIDAEAIEHLMRTVIKKPYYVIGHSFAGFVLGEIIKIADENLQGAVFVDCAFQGNNDILDAREKFARTMLALSDETLKLEAEKWYRELIGPADAEDAELILSMFRTYDHRRLFEAVASCHEYNRRFPPELIPVRDDLRVMIVEADQGVGGDFRKSWVNHFQHARYYLFERSWHFFHVVQNQEFNAVLKRFFSGQD